MQTIQDYWYFYHRYFADAWRNLTPMQYGYLLIAVAAIGWVMMKSGAK